MSLLFQIDRNHNVQHSSHVISQPYFIVLAQVAETDSIALYTAGGSPVLIARSSGSSAHAAVQAAYSCLQLPTVA